MTFDGSKFIAIDSDGLGDGGADSLPVDTLLRNRLRANAAYLNSGKHSAACSFLLPSGRAGDNTTGLNERPYASLDWAIFRVIPVYISKGFRGARFTLKYICRSAGIVQDDVDLRVELHDESRPYDPKDFVLPNTDGATIATTFDFTYELNRPWAGEEKYGFIIISYKSRFGGQRAATVTTNGQTVTGGNAPTFVAGPVTESLEVQYLEDTDGQQYEIVGATATDIFCWPPLEGAKTYTYVHLTYAQFRGIQIQPLWTIDSLVLPTRDDLKACVPEDSRVAVMQALHSDAFDRRPIMVANGPRGMETSGRDEKWGSYMERTHGTYADLNEKIVDTSVLIPRNDPVVDFLGIWVCSFDGGGRGVNPLDGGTADWTVELKFSRPDASGWPGTTIATHNETHHFKILPSLEAQRRYQLVSGLVHDIDLIAGQLPFDLSARPADHSWVYKEGDVLRSEFNLVILQPKRFRLQLPQSAPDDQCPMRMEITPTYVANSFNPTFRTTRGNIASLRLELLWFSTFYRGPELG